VQEFGAARPSAPLRITLITVITGPENPLKFRLSGGFWAHPWYQIAPLASTSASARSSARLTPLLALALFVLVVFMP
jgi:hypothetical protein